MFSFFFPVLNDYYSKQLTMKLISAEKATVDSSTESLQMTMLADPYQVISYINVYFLCNILIQYGREITRFKRRLIMFSVLQMWLS